MELYDLGSSHWEERALAEKIIGIKIIMTMETATHSMPS